MEMTSVCAFSCGKFLLASATAVLALHVQGVTASSVISTSFSRGVRTEIAQRVRNTLAETASICSVSGTVTYADEDAFFLQTGCDGVKVFSKDSSPHPGDVVTAQGRPTFEGGRVVLAATTYRKTGQAPLPEPRNADARALTYVGDDETRDVNALVVRITGRVIGLTERGFAMDLGGTPVTVHVPNLPGFLTAADRTRPKVSVVGVAEILLDQSAIFGAERYAIGVRVSTNAARDVTLIPDALYLVNVRDRRIMFAIAGLVTLLAIGLIFAAAAIFRQRRRHFRTVTLMAERKRMADDIHDTIEQHLVGAGMLVQLGRSKEAQDVLVRAKREIRDIVWGLKNDDMMRMSPTKMIRALAREETRKGICRVDARLAGLPEQMDASAMRDLSLIVREAIGNAVKHGGAKKIAISADPLAGNGWLLRVANDGTPFDPAAVPGPAEGHFGLEGMRERARRLRATVSFSRKGNWMVLSLEKKK